MLLLVSFFARGARTRHLPEQGEDKPSPLLCYAEFLAKLVHSRGDGLSSPCSGCCFACQNMYSPAKIVCTPFCKGERVGFLHSTFTLLVLRTRWLPPPMLWKPASPQDEHAYSASTERRATHLLSPYPL